MSGISINTALKSATACTIKAHRGTAEESPTQDAWTDCDGFAIVTSDTAGTGLTLNVDTKTINCTLTGLYKFGGCLHYQNNSGGDREPLIACRILVNGTTEAKCSQRAKKLTQKNNGEDTLSYNGSVYLESGNSFTLQYYCDDSTIDFTSNAVFDNVVAWTLWLNFIGLGD